MSNFVTRNCFTCPKTFDIDIEKGNPVLAMCPACANKIRSDLTRKEQAREQAKIQCNQ